MEYICYWNYQCYSKYHLCSNRFKEQSCNSSDNFYNSLCWKENC